MHLLTESPLGKQLGYNAEYNRDILFPIKRSDGRADLGIMDGLPFKGVDIWNGYEFSWLDKKGKPQVAIGQIVFQANSPNIIESKSLKLYLNSLNHKKFASTEEIQGLVAKDLSDVSCSEVSVRLFSLDRRFDGYYVPKGRCLDSLDVRITDYEYTPDILVTKGKMHVESEVYSHLLRSNCPVTGQPDWGTVYIQYKGYEIDQNSLLKYIVSYRLHEEFHEHCIERIFIDIMKCCSPSSLTVYAQYTRRGGLDINPFRSTCREYPDFCRNVRQ